MSRYLRIAHEQGQTAKANGYERVSPYTKCLAEGYWLAGFDGVDYRDFDRARTEQRKEIKAKLGYSRIGLGNV